MMISPIGVNSNMPIGFMPECWINPLTATLVEVPMSVQVPPRIEANATGMSNFEALTPALRPSPATSGVKSAVTVVLFMKAEVPPTMPIIAARKLREFTCATRRSCPPIQSSTPASFNATLRTKIEPRMMMMSLLNPANASCGVRIPGTISPTSRSSVIMSTVSFSRLKSTMAPTRRINRYAITMCSRELSQRRPAGRENYYGNWWRRGESNPCPGSIQRDLLHA